MQRKQLFIVIGCCVATVILSVAGSYFLFYQKMPKTAYVQLGKVFEKFELKKQLEGKMKQTQTSRKNIIDSLEFQLKAMSARIENTKGSDKKLLEDFEIERQSYLYKKQQFDEDNSSMADQYDQQIWGQLNQYVSEYGKENKYTYIFGAEGNGALMYGNETNDITEAVIEFVNKKYQGQ